MTKQALTQDLKNVKMTPAPRSRKLARFFRAVALFSTPLRSAKFGLRRRK